MDTYQPLRTDNVFHILYISEGLELASVDSVAVQPLDNTMDTYQPLSSDNVFHISYISEMLELASVAEGIVDTLVENT
jgi:hypothetical protein